MFNVLLDHCNITSFSTVRHIHTHAGKQHRIVSGQKTNADDKVKMYYDDVYKLSDLTVRHSPFNRPRTLFAVRLMSAISSSSSSFIPVTFNTRHDVNSIQPAELSVLTSVTKVNLLSLLCGAKQATRCHRFPALSKQLTVVALRR